jgi:hypothetical protein
LDKVVPYPSWEGATKALHSALSEWREPGGRRDDHIKVVVGMPGGPTSELVADWALEKKWPVVDAPTLDEILQGGKRWLSGNINGDETPLALPCLDRFYLRHYDGLELLTRLFDRLHSTHRQCLIGCGSWSWAYLSRAMKIEPFLSCGLTLEAFDDDRLQRWFLELAGGDECPFVFRQSDDSGSTLFTSRNSDRNPREQVGSPEECSDFLKYLAAFSRGISHIAWAGWRHSLGLATEGHKLEKQGADESLIAVPPWSELGLPDPPGDSSQDELVVLHNILIHGSMSTELLAAILPISDSEITHSLQRLRAARLLESESGRWRVSWLGYPAARQSLSDAGYFVDVL